MCNKEIRSHSFLNLMGHVGEGNIILEHIWPQLGHLLSKGMNTISTNYKWPCEK